MSPIRARVRVWTWIRGRALIRARVYTGLPLEEAGEVLPVGPGVALGMAGLIRFRLTCDYTTNMTLINGQVLP